MDIYNRLRSLGIPYRKLDHPAVWTAEDADRVIPECPGIKTKNLFLRDRKGRTHILVVLPSEESVDLDALAELCGCSKLGIASKDRLKAHLHVDPGAVSLLSLALDAEHKVSVVIGRRVWECPDFQCHPLENTSTLILRTRDIARFLEHTGHPYRILDVPTTHDD